MEFDVWMKEVDRFIAAKLGGFTSGDIPDFMWYDLYDSGLSPREAFNDWEEDDMYGFRGIF